jgi:hypothetical protein
VDEFMQKPKGALISPQESWKFRRNGKIWVGVLADLPHFVGLKNSFYEIVY